jgi:hypothetical protein
MEHTQKETPKIAHLTFTKVQVWGRMVTIPKVPCTKMMITMLALSCYKKRGRRVKKAKKREEGFSSLKAFAHHYNQATAAAVSQPPTTYADGEYTQVCKGHSLFTNSFTHICLHKKID